MFQIHFTCVIQKFIKNKQTILLITCQIKLMFIFLIETNDIKNFSIKIFFLNSYSFQFSHFNCFHQEYSCRFFNILFESIADCNRININVFFYFLLLKYCVALNIANKMATYHLI